ncbi:MAG: hypothetical protein FWE16_00330 [Firmicutes bacterium]|nr:hypothetical protein [Bacillota bacterium]
MEDALTFDDFKEMERIDRNIGFNHVTPAEICYEQYKKFPQIFVLSKIMAK